MNGLYIHIPFCKVICSYCDFYKMVAKDELKTKYIRYLIKEIELKKQYLTNIKTIYIGGGTPSSLNSDLLLLLFENLSIFINLEKLEEFTIEANPNDINQELINLFKKYHINRISLGVQSLDSGKLKLLNRTHDEEDVKMAINLLKENNITNINVDLIYGVSNESFKSVKNDLKKLIKYGVKHISAYSLILEEKTIFYKLFQENKFQLANEEDESKIYQKIQSFLKKKYFNQYEISNFSRKFYQSKHNLLYWDNMNYIGVGASSSYYIGNTRYTNIRNLNAYFEGIDNKKLNYQEVITLTKAEQMNEHMMLGFRKIKGININDFFERYQEDVFEVFPFINQMIKNKMLKKKNNYLFIPKNKLYLSNEVLVKFV